MNGRPTITLRFKLVLFSATLVLVLGVLTGVLAERNSRDSLQTMIGRQLAREADHTAERLDSVLRNEIEALASVARQGVMRQLRVSDVDKRVAQTLAAMVTGTEARAGYVALSPERKPVAASAPRWLEPSSASLWAAIREEPRVVIDPRPNGRAFLVLETPIPDPDRPGMQLGSLVALLDWERLTGAMDRVRTELEAQGINAEILIVEGRDRIVRRSGDSRASRSHYAGLSVVEDAKRGAFAADHLVDEEAGLIVGRAAVRAGPALWTLLVVEPLSHALAPAVDLRRRIAWTTIVVLLVALLVATFAADRVARPLRELTEAIDAVTESGTLEAVVPVRSDDEVGRLGVAFNTMMRDLDETQRHLVEAEKFALVGELAAGVAHEVRTSLGVLRSSAQMITRGLDRDADASVLEMTGMIGEEVGRLARIVDDLLTLDHRRPLDMRSIRIAEPLRSALEFVEPQADDRGVVLHAELTSRENAIACCDRESIRQVAINLLSNAIASVEPGDEVSISITGANDREVVFEVRDTGPGVPAELRDRIFDPFVTGRSSGVGLGLTFVKRVIVSHRGTIELADQPGGACFQVSLPVEVS